MRNRTEDQIEWFLIRHGAVRSNLERRYIGRATDEPLCREGIEALLARKRKGAYPAVGLLFSSPMKRCLETAGILYPKAEPVVIPEWEEMDFGAFEGRTYEELKDCGQYRKWVESGGTIPALQGEGREEFDRRCEAGLCRMLGFLTRRTEEQKLCGTACAVIHGGTIMSLLCRYGGGDYFDYQVSNGGGYRCLLHWDGGGQEDGVRHVRITDIRALPFLEQPILGEERV